MLTARMLQQEHRQHHLPPISDHYCILSGLWNGPLDSWGVFPAIERAVFAATGAVPRSWGGHVPASVDAQQPPLAQQA